MTTPNKATQFKRKQYLVSKKFQLKYVGLIMLLMFMTAALCSYVVYYTSLMLLGEKLANVYPQGRLVAIINTVNLRILFSILLISPLVFIIGIFLSHKIAGPIYRMERFLDAIAAGDIAQRLVLRKGDELMVLADAINRASDSLRVTMTDEKARISRAMTELANIKHTIETKPVNMTSLMDSIAKVDAEIRALSKAIEKFKT